MSFHIYKVIFIMSFQIYKLVQPLILENTPSSIN